MHLSRKGTSQELLWSLRQHVWMRSAFGPQRSFLHRSRPLTDRQFSPFRTCHQIKAKNDTKVLKYVEPKSPLVRLSVFLVSALADDGVRCSNKILEQ